jgi:hypothetical protein
METRASIWGRRSTGHEFEAEKAVETMAKLRLKRSSPKKFAPQASRSQGL